MITTLIFTTIFIGVIIALVLLFKICLGLERRLSAVESELVRLESETVEPAKEPDDDGTTLLRGLKKLRADDSRHQRFLDLSRHNRARSSTSPTGEGKVVPEFNTGGELIPMRLTPNEKDILRMFYNEP
jgi:hypothetical protein